MGSLNCLSVSEGDITISFDSNNIAEAIRAKRMITDMLRRGYALLIRMDDGTHTRCLEFDEKRSEYIVADFDPTPTTNYDKDEETATPASTYQPEPEPTIKKSTRGRKRLDMSTSHATAVAPSSGG
jgi:hypothetical protein